LAAIGQGRLIALWDNLFSQLGQPIAQVLLTRGDISDRTRYLNAANTFKELLSMGVVPIVNENDTVSVSEIKFGDNDTLSAITASMIHADYLFLLTDVDGLYTANPRKDPSARLLEVVDSVASIRTQVSTTTLGSSLGTGGMETKLIAAEIATAAGVTTVVTSSRRPQVICDILEYHTAHPPALPALPRRPDSGIAGEDLTPVSGTATPLVTRAPDPISSVLSAPPAHSETNNPVVVNSQSLTRPPHTVFVPSLLPMRDAKSWATHTLHPAGSVIIDTGAHAVLSKRESGGRLLPVGVIGIRGTWAGGQSVRVCIIKDGVEVEVGRGLANYNYEQVEKVMGRNSSYIHQALGYADSEYVVENIVIKIPP
jgi:glutamate 5-kinase